MASPKWAPNGPEAACVRRTAHFQSENDALYIKQHFQILAGQRLPCFSSGDDGFGHSFFGVLEAENFLFHGILADQFVCEHLA
jgi:hypothetical protein